MAKIVETRTLSPQEKKDVLIKSVKSLLDWAESLDPEIIRDGNYSVRNKVTEPLWRDDGWPGESFLVGKIFTLDIDLTPQRIGPSNDNR